jgi:hypothetical protein
MNGFQSPSQPSPGVEPVLMALAPYIFGVIVSNIREGLLIRFYAARLTRRVGVLI